MIRLIHVGKSYAAPSGLLPVLRGIDLEIGKGEFVAVTGPSGSGKSTLLAILGFLDRPTDGRYFFEGEEAASLPDDREAELRNRAIGFVFQAFHLIPTLTVAENLEVPLFYAGVPRADRRRLAAEALERVGLGERLAHRPAELSGGEQQRAAIARALLRKPELVIADEPTGNLDSRTSGEIMSLLDEVHAEGNTIVVATHDPLVAERAGRRIHLVDGAIEADDRRDQLPPDGTAPPADDPSGRTRPGGMGAKGDKG